MDKVYRYGVWNPSPANSGDNTPGLVLNSWSKEGTTSEKTPSIKAVILFSSGSRKITGGSGKAFRVLCQSHDNHTPSLRIAGPLCRNATAEDVAKIVGTFKNFSQAKIETTVQETTLGTGKLQFCGLQKNRDGELGLVPICPMARRDITGSAGKCKEYLHVRGYDITNKREFQMDLSGLSISNFGTISPVIDFFRAIRQLDKPSYGFTVTLSAKKLDGQKFYMLGVDDVTEIKKEENRKKMQELAEKAKAAYEKEATRGPSAEGNKTASPGPRTAVYTPNCKIKTGEDDGFGGVPEAIKAVSAPTTNATAPAIASHTNRTPVVEVDPFDMDI